MESVNDLEPQLIIPADWTFRSANIAAGFDRHVRESLPWYDLATGAVAHVARHYLRDASIGYDIGASNGNIGRALAPTIAARAVRWVGIEPSAEMAATYDAPGDLLIERAEDVRFQPFSVAVAFLSMMFVPVRSRRLLLDVLLTQVETGGAIIIFDKREAERGYASTVLARLTLAGKLAAGVDPVEIISKETSLAGIQRPLAPGLLPIDAVEFFRFGEFSGWLIEASA